MKTAGIIAEYNPFHLGHQHQINYVKEIAGADYIIIAMSGDYVQRGAPALLPKHIRTEMALRGGADLVLELPAAVSTASAEAFARGGVELLDSLNVVDFLCFGSESGEMEPFRQVAQILTEEPEEYREKLRDFLRQGMSFPTARSRALLFVLSQKGLPKAEMRPPKEQTPTMQQEEMQQLEAFLSSPNNILGIEYCKALLKLHSDICPVTLLRQGSGYHETELSSMKMPSASAVRRYIAEQEFSFDKLEETLRPYLGEASAKLLTSSVKARGFVTENQLDLLLHYCLFTAVREDTLTEYQDMSDALAKRISNTINQYQNFQQYVSLLKTREITQTRIQRALLHVLLRIKAAPAPVGYARVLGFQKSAAPLLSAIKKNATVPLITKAADAPGLLTGTALQAFEETVCASNIYESLLCSRTHNNFRHEYQKPVVIL